MRKFLLALAFTCLSVLTSYAQTATPTPKAVEDDGDVVKISTTLIQIDVTVTDKNGRVISDLKPEEIEIFENGEKQDISNFSFVSNIKTPRVAPTPKTKNEPTILPPPQQVRPEQVRRTIALVVDDLSLSFESTNYVKMALKKFVNEQMQDGDLVAIIRTGAGIGALQQFTADKRQLLAAIEKVRWNLYGAGGIGAFEPLRGGLEAQSNPSDESEITDETDDGGETELNNFRASVFASGTLSAVDFIVRGMQELPGRKSIMLLSDGFEIYNRSQTGGFESSGVLESLRRLVDLANRASVVIYTMDARGLQPLGLTAADDTSGLTFTQMEQRMSDRRNKFFSTQEGLVYLARQTGGLTTYNNNNLSKGIERMLDDQSYYLIGYQPDTETFDADKRRFNNLVVKVNRKGARVRYRSGFFGITDEQIKTPTNQTREQQILTALTSPFAASGISLRLNTLFGNDAKQGSFVRSLLHINAKDLKFVEQADGTQKAVFDILAVSFGDNGAVAEQIAQSYTLLVKGETYRKIVNEGFVYHFTFPVKKPGAFQYRVAIRDSETQKVGSANQFIEVPNLKKERLTISGVVLENLTAEQWNKLAAGSTVLPTGTNQPQATSALNDTSLRRFKRGTILRYAFEIYNAKLDALQKPKLFSQVRVFRDGKSIFEGKNIPLKSEEQIDLQRLRSTGAINLGNEMQAGDYVMQIVITDELAKKKRSIAAQFVQFEITE